MSDNGDDAVIVEKEISYSMNFSQDVLYKILNSYIIVNHPLAEQYFDLYDERDVRTRMFGDDTISSVAKCTLQHKKFVHWLENTNVLVPLVWRESTETAVSCKRVLSKLNKIVQVNVYRCEGVEIKFEHVYFSQNDIDSFDATMSNKIMKLLCLLERTDRAGDACAGAQNSQLGSDEIFARIRVECEFGGAAPERATLDAMCKIIVAMEAEADGQNIAPSLPYTTLLDRIIPRKFEHEQRIVYRSDGGQFDNSIVKKWALKLDGVRGRGLFMRNFCLIQTDDMQFFASRTPSPFRLNSVVAFQCEVMNDGRIIYVTDVLQIFKYKYNNRTQYECGVRSPYIVDAALAAECVTHLNRCALGVTLDDTTPRSELRFQQFFDPPIRQIDYTTVAVDGYVVLDKDLRYIKYKWITTTELEYDQRTDTFNSSQGPVSEGRLILSDIKTFEHGHIYECAVTDTAINVIKHRPDRIVPN
uniref:DekiORF67 n=1 Tax=Dendrolimus kikuchii nucleopolyhedrovirus TaxID=1219875 RepID=V9LSY3_9ABAC|nr:DekiORF67 [Dendrolimus kikuchii nucleopolyhedrovirus]